MSKSSQLKSKIKTQLALRLQVLHNSFKGHRYCLIDRGKTVLRKVRKITKILRAKKLQLAGKTKNYYRKVVSKRRAVGGQESQESQESLGE